MATALPLYRQAYTAIVTLLNQLKPFKDAGQSLDQAAQALGLSVADITPYWPYASWGEVAISDPRVFPDLYFLKGFLALQALRTQMGDELFFQGFKKVFAVGTSAAGHPRLLPPVFRIRLRRVPGGFLPALVQRAGSARQLIGRLRFQLWPGYARHRRVSCTPLPEGRREASGWMPPQVTTNIERRGCFSSDA